MSLPNAQINQKNRNLLQKYQNELTELNAQYIKVCHKLISWCSDERAFYYEDVNQKVSHLLIIIGHVTQNVTDTDLHQSTQYNLQLSIYEYNYLTLRLPPGR